MVDQASALPSNLYWAEVDPEAPNNPHAFALELIGRNKRVLELGPAAGHFTRALVAAGCRVVGIEVDADAAAAVGHEAERVIVGDLSDPAVVASAIDAERFDVVVGGDVLEHLPDPLRVLRACRAALKPGGYVVLSLPNIAHADVKLQLLAGQFRYRDMGLLDRTHLHFFTLASIHELLADAGLMLVDLRRVVAPVFGTEQAVDPVGVAPEVLSSVLDDEESETYQFVVRAVVHDGDAVIAEMAKRLPDVEASLSREVTTCRRLQQELESVKAEAEHTRTELQARLDEAEQNACAFEALAREHQSNIEALRASRGYRLMAPFRALFARRNRAA